jgi:ABC-type nitrate/sulfonate/bicarbonate transport system substrate-binding protein
MIWYPSGAPQVKAAVDEGAWDIGGAGVVPNILGGPQGIMGIGISMDQSATNQLVGNGAGVELWPPESAEGIPIVVSPNSTGDYVVQACLKSQGFNIDNVEFIYEQQQAGCIEAMSPDGNGTARANLGGLWAPNTYKFLETVDGAETICTGASVYAKVTGGHMARRAFTEEKPRVVAKVLAGWLRAVEFIKEDGNKNEVLDFMTEFFSDNGVDIPKSSLELDLRLVGLFGLDQQLDLMERKGGGDNTPTSRYDIWTNEVGNFMKENGVISEVPDPATYITDEFMKLVNADPMLKNFATGGEMPSTDTNSAAGAGYVLTGTAALVGSFVANL